MQKDLWGSEKGIKDWGGKKLNKIFKMNLKFAIKIVSKFNILENLIIPQTFKNLNKNKQNF